MTKTTLDHDGVAIPISIRLPADIAVRVYELSERMGMSSGKFLAIVLEDVLPTFDSEAEPTANIRMSRLYKTMADTGLLRPTNTSALRDRILKRADPGGPVGRPPKSRKLTAS